MDWGAVAISAILEGRGVESLERFAQNQPIIEEFVSQWLVSIPTALGRLAHVAMLRDIYTGRYHHPILQDAYSEAAVHQSLLYCHEELFEKVLEDNFEQQEWDLRMCFANMEAPAGRNRAKLAGGGAVPLVCSLRHSAVPSRSLLFQSCARSSD